MEKTKEEAKLIYSDDFISLYNFEGTNVVLSVAEAEYIPIEHFRSAFYEIGRLIERNGWKALIFDKRNLNTFHQPSMEWYYTDWKINLYQKFGLTQHRKILPNEKWFHKCVEAGKNQIFEEHPDLDISMLEIKYAASIQEAVDN